MERTVLRQYQPYVDDPEPRAINLSETVAARPISHQSYDSGGSSASEDELSDPEFGGNYTTSRPKPFPVEYSCLNDHDPVRRFQSPFDTREPGSPPPYRKHPRRDYCRLSIEHLSGTVRGTLKAHLKSRSTLRANRSNDALSLDIQTSLRAHLSPEESTATPLSSQKTNAPCVDTIKESNPLPQALSGASASQRILGHVQSPVADELQREAALERLPAQSDKGPVVNHYPQPERLHDVEIAIETANKAFDLAHVSGTSESFLKSVERVSTAFAIDSAKSSKGQSRTVNILQKEAQGLVNGAGHRTTPGYVDGNERRSNNAGSGYASFVGSSGFPSNATRQGLSRRRDGERSGPFDDEDPQGTPATHTSLEPDIEKRFPCVFHHPENPLSDATLECKTFQQYVSHLRVHHSGNNHRFFYCITCFETFPDEVQRKSHGAWCKNNQCVTEDCPNFGTFQTGTCNHSGKGRQNSQWSKWKALFRLARPGEDIPNLDADGTNPSGSTAADITTLANVGGQGQRDIASASGSRQNHFSSPQVPRIAPMTPAIVNSSVCERQLETFVSLLVRQLDSPEPEGLEMLCDMHSAYMDHDFSTIIDHCQSSGEAGSIKGLLSLGKRLWTVVQTPDGVSSEYVQKLRDWACGILPQHRASFVSPVTSPPIHQMPHELQSPLVAVAARSKDKHRQVQVPATQDFSLDSQDFNHVASGALMFENPPNADFELFGQSTGSAPPNFIDLEHLHRSSCPPGPASYFPFTQRDSAAALHSQSHAYGKQSNTDSAYGSGPVEHDF